MSRPATGRRISIRRGLIYEGAGVPVAPYASDLIYAHYAGNDLGLVSGNVAFWGDAIGTADYAQATLADQPPYVALTPAIGNRPSIGPGNGTTHRLVTPPVDLSALTDITHAISIIYGGGSGVIFDTGSAVAFGAFSVISNGATIGLRWLATAGVQQVFFAATPGNVYRIVYVLHVGSGTTYPLVYVNGASAGSGGTSDRGFNAASAIAIFARSSPVAGWSASSIIDEFMYRRALTVPEIGAVTAFLTARSS